MNPSIRETQKKIEKTVLSGIVVKCKMKELRELLLVSSMFEQAEVLRVLMLGQDKLISEMSEILVLGWGKCHVV